MKTVDDANKELKNVIIYYRGYAIKTKGGITEFGDSVWWGDGYVFDDAIKEAKRLDRFLENLKRK